MSERLSLLLGESPSKAGDRFWQFPLSGRPAERLLRMAGIQRERESDRRIEQLNLKGQRQMVAAYWTLVDHFDTLNVIERYKDAVSWSDLLARERWLSFLRDEGAPPIVVCVGQRAATAVGIGSTDWFSWHGVTEGFDDGSVMFNAVKIPHTSGLNRVYNDPTMEEKAGIVLRTAMTCRV